MEKILNELLEFVDKKTDWIENNDTTNGQVVMEFLNQEQIKINKNIKSQNSIKKNWLFATWNGGYWLGVFMGALAMFLALYFLYLKFL